MRLLGTKDVASVEKKKHVPIKRPNADKELKRIEEIKVLLAKREEEFLKTEEENLKKINDLKREVEDLEDRKAKALEPTIEREKAIEIRELSLGEHEKALEQIAGTLQNERIALQQEKKRHTLLLDTAVRREEIQNEREKELDQRESEIELGEEQLQTLIDKFGEESDEQDREISERELEITRKVNEVKTREEIVEKKQLELNEEKRALKDKEQTLIRGFEELNNKQNNGN